MGTVPFRVREAILRFDRSRAGKSVREFCYEHQISTTTFYRILDQGAREGAAAALRPGSRAPKSPARRYGRFTIDAVGKTRQDLQEEGLDCGPWSIWWRLGQQGVEPLPSRATIARILRSTGQVSPNPRKRPRSSWRRFQRTRANELWQLNGIEHHFTGAGGRDVEVTIYQVIDDCTRMGVGLHARVGAESSAGAQETLQAAFEQYGRPAAVLTDNHRALNAHRLGMVAPLEQWLADQGIRPISGRPAHPQTQGKAERSHQTLDLWLKRHRYDSVETLNTTLGSFRQVYNHERQHQGLGLRITPAIAWSSVDKDGPASHRLNLADLYGQPLQLPPPPAEPTLATLTVRSGGSIFWKGVHFRVPNAWRGQPVHILHNATDLQIFDSAGTLYAQVPWPPPRPQTRRNAIPLTRPPYRLSDPPPQDAPLSRKS